MDDAQMVVSPDQVSIGMLVGSVPRDVVDEAVAVCGVRERRSDGKLPAHVSAYLTLGLALFPEDDYEEVAAKVTGSLDRFGCWDAAWSVPTASGITQARKRLGRKVLAEVFERCCGPVAGEAGPWAAPLFPDAAIWFSQATVGDSLCESRISCGVLYPRPE